MIFNLFPYSPFQHYQITAYCTYSPRARYYQPSLSIWLSVDPMADKYPGVSPYVYCGNNPVVLKDPNGEEIWIGGVKYVQGADCPLELTGTAAKAWNSLNAISNHKLGGKVVNDLSTSTKKYTIQTGSTKNNYDANINSSTGERGNCGGTINIVDGVFDMKKTVSHELFHAYQDENGQYGNTVHNEVEAYMFEAIVCGEGVGHFRPNDVYPMTDPYVKAVFTFGKWGEEPPASETDFNNVFRPIRYDFLRKSEANRENLYTDHGCKGIIPKRNLLRELMFPQ